MMLSDHFALNEFLVSQTAQRLGRPIEPSEMEIANLRRLCVEILEPLRADLGRPIIITSGLRPPWLNKAIGGSRTSAHMFGRAADIIVPGIMPIVVASRVSALQLEALDQCILEFPPHGWTHLGIAALGTSPRGQYLTARSVNGQTVYEVGIRP